ncbi:MAG TPA: septation protein A [Hyphomicrobiaceae bacterium]|jgi:intracellular septation protein|nr:septation protein A [Hyphomicrobiaceae bacterium]
MSEEAKGSDAAAQPHGTKLMIELGPLLAFFLAWFLADIFWATGVLMVATLVSVVASRLLLGRVSPVIIATAVLVVVFGGLTFWFGDAHFIKMKPTIINLLFAGVLLAGLLTGRPLMKLLFGEAFNLTEEGWRKLTVRWMLFFLAMAVVNEIVWRNFSEATWVNFKVFGILPLTLVFAMSQIGLIKRYEPKAEA